MRNLTHTTLSYSVHQFNFSVRNSHISSFNFFERRPKNVFQRWRGFADSFLFQISLKRSPFILQQLYDELLIRKCFGTHPVKKVILRNWRLSEISSVSQRASGSLYYCLSKMANLCCTDFQLLPFTIELP